MIKRLDTPKKSFKIGNGAIAVALGLLAVILLAATAPDMGLTWDEPAYIAASESYMHWFGELFTHPGQALRPEVINRYWAVNSEHPPLDKIWSGTVWILARGVFDDLTAHRLGNILLVGLLIGLLYFWIAEPYEKPAGFFAAAALLAMPRFFFHAHLAALDAPAAVSVFAAAFLFWRTLDRKGWAWGLLLGLVWGLALAFKINAAFMPVAAGLWLLIFRRRWSLIARLAVMGLVAIPVFFALWPWLYPDPLVRVWSYVRFITVDHWKIGQWYLGRWTMPPPWHFSFVMIWAVVPVPTLLLALGGAVRSGKGRKDGGLGWLLCLSVMIPMLALAVGKSMVYDNDRLLMAAFPFIAALAGSGFGRLLEGLRRLAALPAALRGALRPWNPAELWKKAEPIRHPLWAGVIGIIPAMLLLASPTAAMTGLYPHLLSYYSGGVGGLPGAAAMGLETTYWCESYRSALGAINEKAAPLARIWVDQYSHDVLVYYQQHGLLRKDLAVLVPSQGIESVFGPGVGRLSVGSYRDADWILFNYRQTQYGTDGENYGVLRYIRDREPIQRIEYQGVPIMELYRR